jgi:two-component system, OmpR family, sensor kinase
MATHSRSAGFWQSVRRLPDRMPLRTKLITAVLALVAVALVVISIAGVSFLRSYLDGQANSSIQSMLQPGPYGSTSLVVQALRNDGQPVYQSSQGEAVYWLPADGSPLVTALQPVLGIGPNKTNVAGPAISPNSSWLSSGQTTTVAATKGSGQWRVFAYPVSNSRTGSAGGTVIVAVDFTSAAHTLSGLTAVDLIVSCLLLIVLAVVGVGVIRASLKPLTDIEKTAGAIAAGDLTRRVPERDSRTEIGSLGRSLNTMLSQIESAFRAQSRSEAAARRSEERMRQFVADASHELRTPLTAIRGFAEYYRQRGGVASAPEEPVADTADADAVKTALNGTSQLSPADLARIMRRVEQESARMGVLVEDMLLLARLDQQRPLEHTTVDLLALAADAVHDARVVAPNRNINLTVDSGAALLVNGDEVRLRQVIGNLMGNALAHTPDGTPVDVHLRSGNLEEVWAATGRAHTTGYSAGGTDSQALAVLEITDSGPGLTEEQQAHVFERFYRADQARSSQGTGLGLAIVAALVTAHGGAVWVQSEYGHGATFSIALPLAPEAAVHDPDESGLLDEDAEVLDWNGTGDYAEPQEATDSWAPADPQEGTGPPRAVESWAPGDPEEDSDPPRTDDVSGGFHGANAWPGQVSSSTWPSTRRDD